MLSPRQVARMLLERERELLIIEDAVRRAGAGTGSLLVFEGEHGSGKSALLHEAIAAAERTGALPLRATGAELERDFPFGVALQLLEPVLEDVEEESGLFIGPASLARPLFDSGAQPATQLPDKPDFSILHGLYWLAANLAGRQPLLLALDDAHWADPASLRFLLYLCKRLDELPVVVVLAAEPGEPEADTGLLGELTARFAAARVALMGLNEDASEQLVRSIKDDADDDLCRACHEVTRGNPLYLSLVAAELREQNGSGDSPERVRELGSEPIADRVLARLERLGPDAVALARATAVIGDGLRLRQAASLASLDIDAASAAADRLTAAQVLTLNGRLAFAHPIVRNSVLSSLEPAERSRLRLGAAELLAADGSPPERVASQLLEAQEQGSDWVVQTLIEAAERALAQGAPESAVSYLRRAVIEPPDRELRPRVQLLLGQAEAAVGEPNSLNRLEKAIELLDDPAARASVRLELGRGLHLQGRHREAVRTFKDGLGELDGDSDLALRLETAHVTARRLSYEPVESIDPLLARGLNGSDTAVARDLLAHAAFESALGGGRDAAATIDLAQRALAGGTLLEEEGPHSLSLYLATTALTLAEDLQAAELVLALALDEADRCGSLVAVATASHFRGMTVLRRGRLRDAEADLRSAAGSAPKAWRFALPASHALLAECHLARGDVDSAWREVENADRFASEDDPWLPILLVARGQVQDARGRRDEALDDLRTAGRLGERLGALNPSALPWRSAAAAVLHRAGEEGEAVQLAEEEVQAARAFGAPGPEGRALRVLGTVVGGREGLAHLERAVELLEGSQAALERARAHVELGAALRRARRRSAARVQLQAGGDLAKRCGADQLGARAHEELVALGSRPRRLATTGREALTPRELQVAELAADGLSNRQISERLFVTLKTVEWHLRNSFEKLDVDSRAGLKSSLHTESPGQ